MFETFENFDYNMNIRSSWESIRENIKTKSKRERDWVTLG